jgi:hypothetical protein
MTIHGVGDASEPDGVPRLQLALWALVLHGERLFEPTFPSTRAEQQIPSLCIRKSAREWPGRPSNSRQAKGELSAVRFWWVPSTARAARRTPVYRGRERHDARRFDAGGERWSAELVTPTAHARRCLTLSSGPVCQAQGRRSDSKTSVSVRGASERSHRSGSRVHVPHATLCLHRPHPTFAYPRQATRESDCRFTRRVGRRARSAHNAYSFETVGYTRLSGGSFGLEDKYLLGIARDIVRLRDRARYHYSTHYVSL